MGLLTKVNSKWHQCSLDCERCLWQISPSSSMSVLKIEKEKCAFNTHKFTQYTYTLTHAHILMRVMRHATSNMVYQPEEQTESAVLFSPNVQNHNKHAATVSFYSRMRIISGLRGYSTNIPHLLPNVCFQTSQLVD